jgi:hypothetical protein
VETKFYKFSEVHTAGFEKTRGQIQWPIPITRNPALKLFSKVDLG